MIWEYDDIDKYYLAGTPAEGCGVYRKVDDKKFYGNVSFNGELTHIGPYKTKDDAMQACETELENRKEQSRRRPFDFSLD